MVDMMAFDLFHTLSRKSDFFWCFCFVDVFFFSFNFFPEHFREGKKRDFKTCEPAKKHQKDPEQQVKSVFVVEKGSETEECLFWQLLPPSQPSLSELQQHHGQWREQG